MTKYRVRITRQAVRHLKAIRDYIIDEFHAPDTAKRMLRLLREKMASLSEMPGRIKTIDEQPWGDYGFRKVQVKNYYIYFWINEEEKKVQVIGVIYVKMDQVGQLAQMDIEE